MVKSRIPFVSAIITIVVTACGSQLSYNREEAAGIRNRNHLDMITYQTRAGYQASYYYYAGEGLPEKLVLVFPGIRSRAYDWLDFAVNFPQDNVGFLLMDYPGRGKSQGNLRPQYAWETPEYALQALTKKLAAPSTYFSGKMIFVGHSFGTGAALQFVKYKTPRAIVLMAPFTKLRKLLVRRLGLLGWLIPNGMNNIERIAEIRSQNPEIAITIFHGDNDKSIPVTMSRELAKTDGVGFFEVPGGDHVSILRSEREKVYRIIENQ